jgi:hypothetical protein
MKNQSYIEMDSSKIKELCIDRLREVREFLESRKESFILSRREWTTGYFWKKRKYTEEELELMWKNDPWGEPHHKYTADNWIKSITDILQLALYSDVVYITAEDLKTIQPRG